MRNREKTKFSDLDQDREEQKLLLDSSSPPVKTLNGAEPNYHSLPATHMDEQALLSSILAKTASNIIDVSAADSQGMEHTRLADLSSSLTHGKKQPPLPSLTSQPQQVLASDTVPFADLEVDHAVWGPMRTISGDLSLVPTFLSPYFFLLYTKT
uniref:Ragulator complex protein LAMTOR1 n=1 Tax=Vombatus ursinus TaxID=29139 RepID=A0A4X2L4Q1_VOMUR